MIYQLKKHNGKFVTENLDKANVLSQQFEFVFTSEDTIHIPAISKDSFPAMPYIGINFNGVSKLFKNPNTHKAYHILKV